MNTKHDKKLAPQAPWYKKRLVLKKTQNRLKNKRDVQCLLYRHRQRTVDFQKRV